MDTKFNFLTAILMKKLAEKKGVTDSREAMKIAIIGGYTNSKHPLSLMAPIKMADEQVAQKNLQITKGDLNIANEAIDVATPIINKLITTDQTQKTITSKSSTGDFALNTQEVKKLQDNELLIKKIFEVK